MATYNPPSFPRRPKRTTFLSNTRYHLELAYYRYSINTALYVMSPGEKLAFNMIVLSALSLLAWAVWVCAVWWCVPCSALAGRAREFLGKALWPSSLLSNNLRMTGSYVGADLLARLSSQANNLPIAKGGLHHSVGAMASWPDFWMATNTSAGLLR